MSEKTKKEHYEHLYKLVAEFERKLTEAERYADEFGLEFDISPAYGMGGTYYGTAEDVGTRWEREKGWMPSSQSC
jgi:hypothetical protein